MEKLSPHNFFSLSNSSKKEIICYLLREFYRLGWCTGTGGGISIRESEDLIYLAPSGVHKEFVTEEDIFESNNEGQTLVAPKNPKLKVSECTPLFIQAYKLRDAGAVLHSHSVHAVIITKLFGNEFQCIDLEMIKGITGYKNTEWCRIPIIENTEFESELTDRLRCAILAYPRSYAVLVRNHGIYVWGPTWEKAKNHVECYDFLFKAVLKMFKYNLPVPKNLSADENLRAWMIDEVKAKTEDVRNDLQEKEVRWVHSDKLASLGVLYWKLSGEQKDETLEKICVERNYKNRDLMQCGIKICDNYQELVKKFSQEHIHEDEEIRYILNGSGYFDVRNLEDQFVRIQVKKGDLLVLPEGIYHRYVPDNCNYIHAMRLFKDLPKWIPINRPCNENPSRLKYLKEFAKK